jgi:hypothetical protein
MDIGHNSTRTIQAVNLPGQYINFTLHPDQFTPEKNIINPLNV